MPKAIRYKHNGQYLQNTLFWTAYDYVGAYHAQPGVFDAVLAAEEEATIIASHKQDFAVVFGIPADEIECEAVAWDGRDETLPFASDNSAPVQRISDEQREGYVAPEKAPDPQAFKLAAYAYLDAAAFVMPLAGYIAPALDALNAANWALTRQIIGYAAQAQALTAGQYADINDMLAEHGIPEA